MTFREHGVSWIRGVGVVEDLVLCFIRNDECGASIQVLSDELDDRFDEWFE